MRNNQSKGDDNMNSDAARLFVDYVIKDNDAARLRDDWFVNVYFKLL